MKRIILLCLVVFVVVASCSKSLEGDNGGIDAISALAEQTNINNNKIYVYKDYALGWNRFIIRSFVGEKGIKPPDMEENYEENPYLGISSIKVKMNFTAQTWGGYIFTNGSLLKGDTEPNSSQGDVACGENLSGASTLTIHAKGLEGGEKIEFFCGGLGYTEFGASVPYADSSPKISSGIVTLTKEWKAYTISLSGKNLSQIGNGFGWIAYEKNNRNKGQIEFYLDEIYFTYKEDSNDYGKMVFPASYEPFGTITEEYILNNMAYINDSSVTAIALFRGGKIREAEKILNSLVFAVKNDRSFSDSRLRNGYICGNIESYFGWNSNFGGKYSLLPGFYHKQTEKWHEDFYSVSTNLTSLAWGILALCEGYEKNPENIEYKEAAEKIAIFALSLKDINGEGFFAGYNGWEGAQEKDLRKPVRDNLEIYAALMRLASLNGITNENISIYMEGVKSAEVYVLSQFDESIGCFLPGDKIAAWDNMVFLSDNALAVLILPEKYTPQKERVLQYIEDNMAISGGYACNDNFVEGIYWEGTAQTALAVESVGNVEKANKIKIVLSQNQISDGMMPSASMDKLFSGRENPNDNRRIYFYNRKHIGATAYKALADMGANPFYKENN